MQNENSLLQLGKYYLSINQLDLALNVLQEAVIAEPNNAVGFELLAQIANMKGDEASTYQLLLQACSNKNCTATAQYHLSQYHLSANRFAEAIELLEQSIVKNGEYFEALHDLGTCHANQGSLDKAIHFYTKALQIKSDIPELFFNLGRLQDELKNYSEALAYYNKALNLDEAYAEAWSHKGLALHELGKYEEALNAFETALKLAPEYPEALSNKAVTLHTLRYYEEALSFYDKALSLNPNFHDARWNKASTQLVLGNFQEGLLNYEFRWKKSKDQGYKYSEIPPLLSSENLTGKKILIWSEQGYGDTLQFSRYIPLLLERGAEVIFEVQKPLLSLLKENIDCEVVENYESSPNVDYQSPLLTLPLIFKTTLDSIPPVNPIITPSKKSLEKWGKTLVNLPKKINIGFACSGNPGHIHDRNRSMPLSNFLPLLNIANLNLIQMGVRPGDEECLREHPEIQYFGDQFEDFEDTAALISSMDLIISVDTSLVHLAGTMGKKVFLLLPFSPEWRWMTDGEKSPWYPSARIYRQTEMGAWGPLIQQIEDHLKLA